MFEQAISLFIDSSMAIGPILGYVSQYRLISFTKSVGSFSIDICGILLFANILRLNFYIFKTYETALVFQSIFMIGMQILLLNKCCKYPPSNQQQDPAVGDQIQPALPKQQQNYPMERFWRWKSFQKFGVTILFFIFCTFVASFIFKLTPAASGYGQLVGLFALMSESILIAPQIIKNIQKQSTKGLSHLLVTLNLSGDIFKLIYFFMNQQPFQFILCGIIQVILDSFVIIQIFYYNHHQKIRQKQRKKQQISSNQSHKIKQTIQSQNNLNQNNGNCINQHEVPANLNRNKQFNQLKLMQKKNSKLEIEKDNNEQSPNYQHLNQQIQSDQDDNKRQSMNTQAQLNSQNKNSINNNIPISQIQNTSQMSNKQTINNQQQ